MNGRERGKLLAEDMLNEYVRRADERRPNRLRPSELGHECLRYLWYRFRWADTFEGAEGRLHRLWETGHIQEDRMIADLRRVGANVYAKDPENPKEQIGCDLLDGHSKGFLDGIAENVPHAKSDWVLVECKTHSDKSFKDVEKNGVAVSKPQHFAQMQLYMHLHHLKEGLYVAVNKNDDNMYCEFIDYNSTYADRLMTKAERVVYGIDIPPKINSSGTYFKCKFCSAAAVCHRGAFPARTCRTCIYAKPHKNSGGLPVWECEKWNTIRDLDEQRKGCEQHRYHPDMIGNGACDIEESEEEVTMTYALEDGNTFVDRGPLGDKAFTPGE